MQLNKFQERIIEIGRKKSAKLILPERDDPRVSLAKRQLRELGYDLLEPEDFSSRETQYQEIFVNILSFTAQLIVAIFLITVLIYSIF